MKPEETLSCLQVAQVMKHSGFNVISHRSIAPVRDGYFRKMNWAIVGEAPKDFCEFTNMGLRIKLKRNVGLAISQR